jgi:S-adenosylmethionine decarboxylase
MRNLLLNEGLSVPKSSFLHNVKATPGLHLMGDLFECSCDLSIFTDSTFLETTCSSFVQNAGLTEVGKFFHQFDGEGGVTGMIVLAESHMSLHTWPEKKYVTLDVYVCSYTQDNREKAKNLFTALEDLFQPTNKNYKEIDRL